MTLKNSHSESSTTFERIQRILIAHKAKQISFNYDDDSRIKALSLPLSVRDKPYWFKLPACLAIVERIFYKARYKRRSYDKLPLTDAEKQQAYRTAWTNFRDWLDAQIALIDTDMVRMEEVLLPYMMNSDGESYFEVLAKRRFALPAGDRTEATGFGGDSHAS